MWLVNGSDLQDVEVPPVLHHEKASTASMGIDQYCGTYQSARAMTSFVKQLNGL